MTEQLISFETAKLAKEKGFKGYYGHTSYSPTGKIELWEGSYDHNGKPETLGAFKNSISIPTQSLLQKWLREEHKIHIYVETTPAFDKMQGNKWKSAIKYCFQPFKWTTGHYCLGDTYEEALEKGLVEALNLIANPT